MGETMTVFIEKRRLKTEEWQLDVESSGPVDAGPYYFGAKGITIPRGRELYYMAGYPDDGYERGDDEKDHIPDLSSSVEQHYRNSAGVGAFWGIRTKEEIGIIQRCWAVAGGLHPKDVEEADGWDVSLGKVWKRMIELDDDGYEVRAVIKVE